MAGKKGRSGRPSIYTEKLATEICDRLADGESLNAICKDKKMPDEKTVRTWALQDYKGFFPKYAKAREISYHKMADEVLAMSDVLLVSQTKIKDAKGKVIEVRESDNVARARLKVDTRKWMLSKMLPKIYGDRVDHKHTIEKVEKVEITVVDPTPLSAPDVIDAEATEVTDE